MGVPGLNEITKVDGVETFDDDDFDVCIIDGSNLISVSLFGYREKYTETNDINEIAQGLINDVVQNIQNRVIGCFQRFHCKKLVLTFDTKEALNYNIQKYWIYENGSIRRNNSVEYEIHQFKEEERQIRKIAKEKTVKNEIFVKNDTNILAFIPTVIHLVVSIFKSDDDIDIIETTDEADFVIKNLAVFYGSLYNSVLVLSEDSDYFILLSDLPNVYKTGIKNIKTGTRKTLPPPVYNVSQLWTNYLGTSDYNIICFVAILAGCDYTSFVSMKKSVYEQNGEKVIIEEPEYKKKTLLAMTNKHHIQTLFTDPCVLKSNRRLKFVQNGYLDGVNYGSTLNLNSLLGIISRIEPELIQMYINIINLYHSWRYINKFVYIEANPAYYIEKLKKRFNIEDLNFDEYLLEDSNSTNISEDVDE